MSSAQGAPGRRQILFTELLAALEIDGCKPTQEWMIPSFTSRVEAVLRPWVHRKLNNQNAKRLPNQLAIPLQHKYSKRNLSFDGLESEDRILAEVLRSCKDSTHEPLLEVYLCTLTLELIGYKEHRYPNYGYSATENDMSEDDEEIDEEGEEEEDGEDDEDDKEGEDVDAEFDSKSTSSEEDRGHTMAELEEEDLNAIYWIGWNDEPVDGMTIASRDIVVRNVDDVWMGCFGGTPYKSKYHTGRHEYYSKGCLQQWFRKAVIVVQPRKTGSGSANDERDRKRRRRSY